MNRTYKDIQLDDDGLVNSLQFTLGDDGLIVDVINEAGEVVQTAGWTPLEFVEDVLIWK